MPPKTNRVHCDSYNVLVINNVIYHEHDCPKTWKDQKISYFEYKCNFIRDERYQKICNDCSESSPEDFE